MTDRLANIDRRIQSYLARVDSLPANVAKEIRPEIDELLNSYSDVDEDEHLMMEEIKVRVVHDGRGGVRKRWRRRKKEVEVEIKILLY